MLRLPYCHRNSSAIPWHLRHECFIALIQVLSQCQSDWLQSAANNAWCDPEWGWTQKQKPQNNPQHLEGADRRAEVLVFSASCGTPAAPAADFCASRNGGSGRHSETVPASLAVLTNPHSHLSCTKGSRLLRLSCLWTWRLLSWCQVPQHPCKILCLAGQESQRSTPWGSSFYEQKPRNIRTSKLIFLPETQEFLQTLTHHLTPVIPWVLPAAFINTHGGLGMF